jgi:hypothetical protein
MSETGGWAAPDPERGPKADQPGAETAATPPEGSQSKAGQETPPESTGEAVTAGTSGTSGTSEQGGESGPTDQFPAQPGAAPPPPGWGGQPGQPGQSGQFAHPGQQAGPGQYGPPMPAAPPPPGAGFGPGYGKPGVIPLRPLTLGEILDGAITTMRRNAALMFGAAAVIALVNVALEYLLSLATLGDLRQLADLSQNRALDPQEQLQQLAPLATKTALLGAASLLITVLTTTFLTGFVTVVVGKAVLGRPITFAEAFAEAREILLRLIGLTLLYTLLVAIAPIAGGALMVLAGPVGILFFLTALVLAVWLYVRFSLSSASLVLEKGKVVASLNRSKLLVSGSWWRVFGVLLLAGLITVMISWLISLPFGVAGGMSGVLTGSPTVPTAGDLLLQEVGGLIATTITAPFVASVTALLYIDQRMRKEGMDIQLARAAGSAPR